MLTAILHVQVRGQFAGYLCTFSNRRHRSRFASRHPTVLTLRQSPHARPVRRASAFADDTRPRCLAMRSMDPWPPRVAYVGNRGDVSQAVQVQEMISHLGARKPAVHRVPCYSPVLEALE